MLYLIYPFSANLFYLPMENELLFYYSFWLEKTDADSMNYINWWRKFNTPFPEQKS